MTNLELDFAAPPHRPPMERGRSERDRAITQVVEAEVPDWRARYHKLAETLLSRIPVGETFTGDQLRHFATENGLEKPHHHNTWGGVANAVLTTWLKMARIESAGLGQLSDTAAHARRTPLYRRIA